MTRKGRPHGSKNRWAKGVLTTAARELSRLRGVPVSRHVVWNEINLRPNRATIELVQRLHEAAIKKQEEDRAYAQQVLRGDKI